MMPVKKLTGKTLWYWLTGNPGCIDEVADFAQGYDTDVTVTHHASWYDNGVHCTAGETIYSIQTGGDDSRKRTRKWVDRGLNDLIGINPMPGRRRILRQLEDRAEENLEYLSEKGIEYSIKKTSDSF